MPEAPEAPEALDVPSTAQAAAAPGFLRQRWSGQAPLRTLFWRDMLACGTVLNLGLTFVALMGLTQGLPVAWAVALHFAPTPWNAFLVLAVWRTPGATVPWRGAALLWWAAMLLL